MGFAGEKDVNLTVGRPDPEPGSNEPSPNQGQRRGRIVDIAITLIASYARDYWASGLFDT